MGVARRILSGSLASWTRIGLTVLVQIGLVPLYLSHWTLAQYGCWLVVLAATAFVNVLSLAHHNVVGNRLLQMPRGDGAGLGRLLSAALPFSLGLGLLELLVLAGLATLGVLAALFTAPDALPPGLMNEALASLLLVSTAIWLGVSTSGLYGRLASALGHFARGAWWGVAVQAVSGLAPATAVLLGAGLWQTACALAGAHLAVNALYQVDLWRLARRHGVQLQAPDWGLGWHQLRASTLLGLSYACGLLRQQGLRVLVGGLLGVGAAVAFTTLRTASNLSLQGIATVTDPVFPEFMGFLRDRQQAAIVGTFAFLWLTLIFLLGPALVVLQAVAPPLFGLWTQDKLPFDAPVFACFSVALLLFATARPADAILLGQNHLRTQLALAAFAALATVLGVLALNGRAGLAGVAGVLVAVEGVLMALTVWRAAAWLREQGLAWPSALFRFALAQVLVCAAAMAWIAAHPADRAAAVSAVSATMALSAALFTGFVMQLPPQHRAWLAQRLGRFTARWRGHGRGAA
jgi:O-antigen/teichoic acid export membrane protein